MHEWLLPPSISEAQGCRCAASGGLLCGRASPREACTAQPVLVPVCMLGHEWARYRHCCSKGASGKAPASSGECPPCAEKAVLSPFCQPCLGNWKCSLVQASRGGAQASRDGESPAGCAQGGCGARGAPASPGVQALHLPQLARH